ncbi:MAG: ribosome-associated translation inhibitor RaiA [Candidatus Omnitrophota bacterium]
MRLTVVGRHFNATEPIKKYVDKKLLKLDRFARKIKEAHAILEVQKIRHIAEVTLYLKNAKLTAMEETGDMYASVDNAVANLQKQLVRLSDKIKRTKKRRSDRKYKETALDIFRDKTEESAAERPPRVIQRSVSAKPMSVEEACMELDLFKESFLVFKEADSGKTNIVYKRDDGNYGLIVPK